MPANIANIEDDPTRIAEGNEDMVLSEQHLRLTQVTLHDQTDVHNDLVHERSWLLHPAEMRLKLRGNLFVIEETLTGRGVILVKEAPLPEVRPTQSENDLEVSPLDAGFAFKLQREDGYAWHQLTYEGGRAGARAALHAFQQRYWKPAHAHLLSNTWGDRSRDARICHDFVMQEIEAGAKLSVDVVQLDDGWQQGITSNSAKAKEKGGVWEGFWASDANFWDINSERFPHGLEPLVEAAAEHGMTLGLWFAPDSSSDFANWRRDAEKVADLHTRYDVRHIKIDGVKARTAESESNLRRFFDTALGLTHNEVAFDLDVTAEVRPGYFGMMHTGPLFIENRYTDWHRYWPHQTLRSLWKLSQWIDPRRLRMEWLNNARNVEKYEGDPLGPGCYSPDYLFATTMFAQPLGWFETSNLPRSYSDEAGPLIARWREHREAIFAGEIHPIGTAPDGTSWAGFVSVDRAQRKAHALVFRELNEERSASLALPRPLEGVGDIEVLGGEGEVAVVDDGKRLNVTIDDPQRFVWASVGR